MTDYLQFLFVLALLALCECFEKTGPAAWVYRAGRRLAPQLYPGNGSWGWVVALPWRPATPLFACSPLPVLFAPSGVVANPRYHDGVVRVIPWAQAKQAVRRGPLVEAGGHSWTCASPADAARLTALLAAGSAPRALDRLYDRAAARARWERFAAVRRRLVPLVAAQALWVALAWPLAIRFLGFAPALALAAAGLYAASWLAWRALAPAHRELFPDLSEERRLLAVKLALYPLTALRAIDALSIPLLAGFDRALLVELAAAPATRAADLAALYREANCPAESGDEPERRAIRDAHAELAARLRPLLQAAGGRAELTAPAPEPACQSWCPLCLAQFRLAEGVCTSCRGVMLRPFAVEETGA